MKNNSNPVYLKLEYEESLDSKKNLLSTEASLLNIVKIIQRYSAIRQEELQLRAKLYKAIKELNVKIRKTRDSFPFLKVPEKTRVEEVKTNITAKTREKVDKNLEDELRQINERLRALG